MFDYEPIPDGWRKGRVVPPITTSNRIWINNGHNAIFIDKDTPIPDGWQRGRLKSHMNMKKVHQTLKNKHYSHYNNGESERLVAEGDTVPDGFVKGRLPMTDAQRKKCSDSHKGLHHTEASKQKISAHTNNNRTKATQTIIEKFGSMDKFYEDIREKSEMTKYQNHTFNTSKPEDEMYKSLCEEYGYGNVYRNFKCERYPFRCDFYIKPIDKFIELNLHWTHGSRPYDANDEFCKHQLLEWKEKAKTSQFYAQAIETWTARDVQKFNYAMQNHLNYEVIY